MFCSTQKLLDQINFLKTWPWCWQLFCNSNWSYLGKYSANSYTSSANVKVIPANKATSMASHRFYGFVRRFMDKYFLLIQVFAYLNIFFCFNLHDNDNSVYSISQVCFCFCLNTTQKKSGLLYQKNTIFFEVQCLSVKNHKIYSYYSLSELKYLTV